MNTQINTPASVKALLAKIGSQLKAAREEQNLSREDVCRALKMHINFLIALEEGLFEDLPGAASFFSSLRSYSRFLGLDAEKIIQECKKNHFLFQALQGEGIIQRPGDQSIIENKSNKNIPTSLDKLSVESKPLNELLEDETPDLRSVKKKKNISPLIILLFVFIGLAFSFYYWQKNNSNSISSSDGICSPFKLIANKTTDIKIIALSINQVIVERTLEKGEAISFSDIEGIQIEIPEEDNAITLFSGIRKINLSKFKQSDNLYVFKCK